MATSDSVITVLEHSLVTPPASVVDTEMSLPLTFFDMLFLDLSAVECLVFYEVPQLSRTDFIDNFIPKFKYSLSLTLKYFLPLAGNLILPPQSSSGSNSSMPEIRYTNGNSVILIFAECKSIDFNYLVSNDARNSCEFHPLIPELKPSFNDDSRTMVTNTPVAFQVTLFPNYGISIGKANHHGVADGSSMFNFMKTWAAIHSKLLREDIDEDDTAALVLSDSPPLYDRTAIKDTKGLALFLWNQRKHADLTKITTLFTNVNKVRKTFVISQKHVKTLKNLVLGKGRKSVHLSSYTVICGYVWTCLVKSRSASGEKVDDEELEHFSVFADCRRRLDPPLPENYFGNCLTFCLATAKNGTLVGEEGFCIAAELIGEAIHQRLLNSDSLFNDAETWFKGFETIKWERIVGVAGSPRFNYNNLDFGWGKPIKFEFVSIDNAGAISLCGSRESDGDVEVGLSLPKPKMNAFTIIFKEGLNLL